MCEREGRKRKGARESEMKLWRFSRPYCVRAATGCRRVIEEGERDEEKETDEREIDV